MCRSSIKTLKLRKRDFRVQSGHEARLNQKESKHGILLFTTSTSSSGSFHRNLYLLEVSIILAAEYLTEKWGKWDVTPAFRQQGAVWLGSYGIITARLYCEKWCVCVCLSRTGSWSCVVMSRTSSWEWCRWWDRWRGRASGPSSRPLSSTERKERGRHVRVDGLKLEWFVLDFWTLSHHVHIVKEEGASYRLHDHFLSQELPLGVQNLTQIKRQVIGRLRQKQ